MGSGPPERPDEWVGPIPRSPTDPRGQRPVRNDPPDPSGQRPVRNDPPDPSGQRPVGREPTDPRGQRPVRNDPSDPSGQRPVRREPTDPRGMPAARGSRGGSGAPGGPGGPGAPSRWTLPGLPTLAIAGTAVLLAFLLGRITDGGGETTTVRATPAAATTTTTAPTRHTVARGESLLGIASRYGITAEALAAANDITNQNHVFVGQVLVIPPSALPSITTTTNARATTSTR